ncbi:hypothetical protein D3C75_1196240 [compost metagenome]
MLPVYIDQLFTDLTQHAEIHHLPVDPRGAFAKGGDFTADNQMLLPVGSDAKTFKGFPYRMAGG